MEESLSDSTSDALECPEACSLSSVFTASAHDAGRERQGKKKRKLEFQLCLQWFLHKMKEISLQFHQVKYNLQVVSLKTALPFVCLLLRMVIKKVMFTVLYLYINTSIYRRVYTHAAIKTPDWLQLSDSPRGCGLSTALCRSSPSLCVLSDLTSVKLFGGPAGERSPSVLPGLLADRLRSLRNQKRTNTSAHFTKNAQTHLLGFIHAAHFLCCWWKRLGASHSPDDSAVDQHQSQVVVVQRLCCGSRRR